MAPLFFADEIMSSTSQPDSSVLFCVSAAGMKSVWVLLVRFFHRFIFNEVASHCAVLRVTELLRKWG